MRNLTPRSLAVCLAMLALACGPAFATDPPPSAQDAPAPAGPQGPETASAAPAPGSQDEVICKVRDDPVMGTRINRKRKICRTRREWAEQARIGQDTLNDVQESGRTQSGIAMGRKGGKGN